MKTTISLAILLVGLSASAQLKPIHGASFDTTGKCKTFTYSTDVKIHTEMTCNYEKELIRKGCPIIRSDDYVYVVERYKKRGKNYIVTSIYCER